MNKKSKKSIGFTDLRNEYLFSMFIGNKLELEAVLVVLYSK